jgi:ABC-type branched-subunit amino acid transport system ATPase component
MLILEANSLRRSFGGVVAVDDVSLAVAVDEVVGVIGPNGSGKTTMVNLLTRIIPLEHGDMRFCGSPYEMAPPESLLRLGLARTFQNLRLFADLTVRENVELVACRSLERRRRFRKPSEQAIRDAADAVLERFGIADLGDRLPNELPYGDQRRVEIARALAAEPKLLLLDEPFAGMARHEAQVLCDVLRRAKEALGLSLVIVDHDMETLSEMCSRFVALARGRVLAEGTPAEVLANREVITAYVGDT